MDKRSILDISVTEAFELGRIEGQKEAFEEISKLADTEISFLRVYLKARLTSIANQVSSMKLFKRN